MKNKTSASASVANYISLRNPELQDFAVGTPVRFPVNPGQYLDSSMVKEFDNKYYVYGHVKGFKLVSDKILVSVSTFNNVDEDVDSLDLQLLKGY